MTADTGAYAEHPRWLLITITTAAAAPSLRMQVWRKLRSLGALYLQQSVCLLPAQSDTTKEVRRLLARVHEAGGSGRALSMVLSDPQEQAAIITELNAARDDEYAEILERVPSFVNEIDQERQRGRATYTEVEESEADLERFRSWLAKIEQRDYFGAPGRLGARRAIDRCVAALEAFEAEALDREAPASDSENRDPAPAVRLRLATPSDEQADAS